MTRADPGIMDDETVAELRALRARAYGPGADLDDDPAALRRLNDLEELVLAPTPSARVRAAVPATASEAPVSATAVGLPMAGGTGGETGADSPLDPEDAPPEPSDRPQLWWTRRRLGVLWALSLVVVLVVSAVASAAFTYRVQADPREEAVLSVDPTGEVPEVFGGGVESGGQVYEDFYGLVPLVFDYGPSASAGLCLQIVDVATLGQESRSTGELIFGGCGVGSFPVTASFVVSPAVPSALRDRFPVGSSLQFVLEDSRIVVLSSPPPPEADPSQEAAR